jgi:hypothetical protein
MASKIKSKTNKNEPESTAAPPPPPTSASQVQVLKFPYPVLNDKRNIKEILDILQAKEIELNKKIQQTRTHYKEKTSKTDKDLRDKLKILYKNFKSQLSKIETQIDYIKTDLKLKKLLRLRIKKNDETYKEHQHVSLKDKHEKLVSFMKNENRKFLLKNSKNLNKESDGAKPKEDTPPPVVLIGPAVAPPDYYQNVPPPTLTAQWNMQQTQMHTAYMQPQILHQPQFGQQIGGVSQYPPLTPFHSTYNSVSTAKPQANQPPTITSLAEAKAKSQSNIINYLIYTIAQTSAAAHAAASITAAAYNPPPPPPSSSHTGQRAKHGETLAATNRNELAAKATSSFAKYKDRIKSFLETDKNLLMYKNPLQAINMEYDDNNEKASDDDSDRNYELDQSDGHSVYSDDDSDTELEIILKSSANTLNYVLPSTKPRGLQITWEQYQHTDSPIIDNQSFSMKKNAQLLAAQRSAFSLTFMGTPSTSNKTSSLASILYKRKE